MEYALITGATSGIGYALAECFAKDGVGLVLVSSSLEHLRQTKEKLEQKYDTLIELYEKDLSMPQAAGSAAARSPPEVSQNFIRSSGRMRFPPARRK